MHLLLWPSIYVCMYVCMCYRNWYVTCTQLEVGHLWKTFYSLNHSALHTTILDYHIETSQRPGQSHEAQPAGTTTVLHSSFSPQAQLQPETVVREGGTGGAGNPGEPLTTSPEPGRKRAQWDPQKRKIANPLGSKGEELGGACTQPGMQWSPVYRQPRWMLYILCGINNDLEGHRHTGLKLRVR